MSSFPVAPLVSLSIPFPEPRSRSMTVGARRPACATATARRRSRASTRLLDVRDLLVGPAPPIGGDSVVRAGRAPRRRPARRGARPGGPVPRAGGTGLAVAAQAAPGGATAPRRTPTVLGGRRFDHHPHPREEHPGGARQPGLRLPSTARTASTACTATAARSTAWSPTSRCRGSTGSGSCARSRPTRGCRGCRSPHDLPRRPRRHPPRPRPRADAYLTKQKFDQRELLDTIGQ